MTIPAELLKSTPRPVSLTAGGKAVMVFACLLILTAVIGGVWMYTNAEADAAHDHLHATQAATTEGRILTAQRAVWRKESLLGYDPFVPALVGTGRARHRDRLPETGSRQGQP